MRRFVRDRGLTSRFRRTFIPAIASQEGVLKMFRTSFVFLSALMIAQAIAASPVSAQQGHDACVRDVSRYCRSHMNDDDQAVLSCLKQHRGRLSKACDKMLTDNGQ